MNRTVVEILREARLSTQSEFVLPRVDFGHLHRITRTVATKAGVTSIRFHDLRHTFASHFMMAGGNIYDLQKILGHSTITTTEQYSHFTPDYLKGKTDILRFEAPSLDNVRQLANNSKVP